MRAASLRYCRCKSDITSDIAPWVYIPPDIFGTTNILTGFYEASPGERIYEETSQCIRFSVSRYEGTVGWCPYTDRKFHTNRSLPGKRRFPLTLFITRASLAKDKICNIAERFTLKFHVERYRRAEYLLPSTCRSYFFMSSRKLWNYSERFPTEIISFFHQLSYHGNSDNIWRRSQWFLDTSWASEKSISIGAWLRSES